MSERDDMLRLARHFESLENRLPVRTDWRSENRTHFETRHGVTYPPARRIETVFGSWSQFRVLLGGLPMSKKPIGDAALEHLKARFGERFEVMPGNTGTIDAFLDGERVEVKASTLLKDEVVRTPRWRFRLHFREYSLLVDRLICVGIAGGEPVIEWHFDKVDIAMSADNKDSIKIPAKYPFNFLPYAQEYNELWRKPMDYDALIALEGFSD